MSYTYLLEQGEESLAASFADIPASVLSRLNLTAEKSCCNDNGTECCHSSPSGTMCEHSTENPGKEKSMSSAVAFHARTFPPPEKELESLVSDLDCGPKLPGYVARFDLRTYSWRTAQCSLFGGLEEFSETWPQWGIMRDGEFSEQMPLDYPITEPEFGWLPTPLNDDGSNVNPSEKRRETLASWVRDRNRDAINYGARQNPQWWEWVMLWPLGWTDCLPLETDKFQQWLHSHGKSYQKEATDEMP
jgi:hypothetical protein